MHRTSPNVLQLPLARLGVLAFVATCLALQAVASFRLGCLPHGFVHEVPRPSCAPAMWPFLDYPMFRRVHREGETVHQYSLVALQPGGEEWTVDSFPQNEAADLRKQRVAQELSELSPGTRLRLVRVTWVLGRGGVRRQSAVTVDSWHAGELGAP